MKNFILSILFIIHSIQGTDVVQLTDENFDEHVTNSTDFWMIKFYSPYCGHCIKLAPKWEEAATALKGKVKFGDVDVTTHNMLKERYNIDSFPKLRVFHKGFDYGNGEQP